MPLIPISNSKALLFFDNTTPVVMFFKDKRAIYESIFTCSHPVTSNNDSVRIAKGLGVVHFSNPVISFGNVCAECFFNQTENLQSEDHCSGSSAVSIHPEHSRVSNSYANGTIWSDFELPSYQ